MGTNMGRVWTDPKQNTLIVLPGSFNPFITGRESAMGTKECQDHTLGEDLILSSDLVQDKGLVSKLFCPGSTTQVANSDW